MAHKDPHDANISASEQYARAEALFYSIGDGAISTDEFGRITRVNQVARRILGYKKSELIGEWFPRRIIAVDADNKILNLIDRPITKAFLTGRPVSEKMFYRRRNGQKIPVAVNVSPILVDGKPLGAVEVFRDISFEEEVDRMKSEFISLASHQLRTPMTGIMGYLSMMTSGDFGKIAPEHKKILDELLTESQRMIRLINQFLNVSKIEAGKFTYTKNDVQIEDLVVREIKELNKAATDKKLKIIPKLPKEKLPMIIADADKLQDVILNLIDNAIKYTAEGTITVGVERQGDQIHFFVKDTGIGIRPEDAHELFNKFVRGSGIAQIHPDGSGLGLFIAKSIIDSHGGRIWADSDGTGKGSTFQFTLPISAPVTAQDTVPVADGV